ncbi:MAG: response regulator, partial [Phycisphaerae bacterium]|nr:response regulator [Phycisphaerae bacterium]
TAENGLVAMDILRNTKCRMVITDWEMPEMNGVELCRAIRSEDLGRYIYIILLTCRKGTANTVEGLSAGADDFMSKPFDPSELAVRMRSRERLLSLETRDLTIFAVAKLAESRDPETGAHLERVRSYSKLLAQELSQQEKFADSIDTDFIRLIYLTSPLHDIGKVSIPDHVLLKPGRLDDREFEIMKTHSEHGAATLDSALQHYPEAAFLRMARDIAAYHHERWDGTGYPTGRAGPDIPLCARIFAVADVYDALISKRVYKEAFTHDVAKNIIMEGSGSQFDSDIVEAFLRREADFQAISKHCEEQTPFAMANV